VNAKRGRVKKYEDCGLKVASLGLLAEGKARWCPGCAKAHAGATDVVSKAPRKSRAALGRGQRAGREVPRGSGGRAKRRATRRRRNESPPAR
jgi:hypothetical protein